jgi:hypothetical protein
MSRDQDPSRSLALCGICWRFLQLPALRWNLKKSPHERVVESGKHQAWCTIHIPAYARLLNLKRADVNSKLF